MRFYLQTLFFICFSLSSVTYSADETVLTSAKQQNSSALSQNNTAEVRVAVENTVKENTVKENIIKEDVSKDNPEVGKHVMANMDAMSMTLSLFLVLGLIVVSAYLLKRFQIVQQGSSPLKVVATLSLSAKERVVVVQAGEQQLILGVTPGQITLLQQLEEPLSETVSTTDGLINSSVLSFLKK